MLLAAISLGPLYATWDAFLVFLVLSAITLCTGHSVGYNGGSCTEASSAPSGSNGYSDGGGRWHGRAVMDDPDA